MNESQVKLRILVIRIIDWGLILGILGIGIPAVYYSNTPQLYGILLMFGLAIINRFGLWSMTKIAHMKIELDHLHKHKH